MDEETRQEAIRLRKTLAVVVGLLTLITGLLLSIAVQ
jgi:hypothetical protein